MLDQRRYVECMDYCNIALDRAPGFAEAHSLIAKCYEKIGPEERIKHHKEMGDTLEEVFKTSR